MEKNVCCVPLLLQREKVPFSHVAPPCFYRDSVLYGPTINVISHCLSPVHFFSGKICLFRSATFNKRVGVIPTAYLVNMTHQLLFKLHFSSAYRSCTSREVMFYYDI